MSQNLYSVHVSTSSVVGYMHGRSYDHELGLINVNKTLFLKTKTKTGSFKAKAE